MSDTRIYELLAKAESSTNDDKSLLIDSAGDLLEYGTLTDGERAWAFDKLVSIIKASSDPEVLESTLNAIQVGMDLSELSEPQSDSILNSLYKLDRSSMFLALAILGNTRRHKYLDTLRQYIMSNDDEISEAARIAIDECLLGKK